MDYYKTAGWLRIKAATNRRYAKANRDTVARTNGRGGSLYMAEIHEACAMVADEERARLESRSVQG
jgi:predicted nucleic acid-binding protein